ncbi:leucyl/phenylalanyl-tRNA--protein transferase [Calidifontibacter terrae]
MTPTEPPPSRFVFDIDPAVLADWSNDLVASGGDLSPGTLLAAYRGGFFPMGLDQGGSGPIGWWSPVHRGVLLPGNHRVHRSLRRSSRRFEVTIDTAFAEVVAGCADPSRDGAWITGAFAEAYGELHRLGWAHSIEVWDADGVLAGGLYGVAIGALFAGESMFHRQTDASKVALWAAADMVFDDAGDHAVFDVQWSTPHLAAQGVREISRDDYRRRTRLAVAEPLPPLFR